MTRPSRSIFLLFILMASNLNVAAHAATVDFEDITVPADPSLSPSTNGEMNNPAFGYTVGGTSVQPSYTSGPDGYGDGGILYNSSFTDGGVQFTNSSIPADNSFAGWSVSNVAGIAWPTQSDYVSNQQNDYANQYEYTSFNGTGQTEGGGFNGSPNYATVYDDGNPADSLLTLPAGTTPVSMQIDATTYMALNALYGDNFDSTGFQQGDKFILTIQGLDAGGNPLPGNGIPVLMEDFPVGTSVPWVMDQWTNVDLTPLAGAVSLEFSFNDYSTGYPTNFAVDNLVVATPEPSSLVLALIAGLCVAVAAARKKMRRAIG